MPLPNKVPSSFRGCIILPSLKVSGGVIEALRLAQDLKTSLEGVRVLSMWHSEHSVATKELVFSSLTSWRTRLFLAPLQLVFIMAMFWHHAKRHKNTAWIFTHYATLPLALLVPRRQRFVFVQDLEWNFVRPGWLSLIIKNFVQLIYRRSTLFAANQYLFQSLLQTGLTPKGLAPIWADPWFGRGPSELRDCDVLMILRKGNHKRLDLYLSVIHYLKNSMPELHLAAITTDDEIEPLVRNLVNECYIRPDRGAIRQLYARSKVFLLLSDHEGFALPPLEAMGSGCVPVCRDAGGPRAYMVGALKEGLVPLDKSIQELGQKVISLLRNPELLDSLSKSAVEIFHQGLTRTRFDRKSISHMIYECFQIEIKEDS